MQITFSDARSLAVDILTGHGVEEVHAGIVADHLIDAAVAGHAFAGLPRLMAMVEQIKARPRAAPIAIERKSRNSVLIDGGGTNGYVTSLIGINKAIELAKETGVGLVGIRNTWFSGRLAYYVERAAEAGMIAFHTANTTARVAPSGGIDRIFGTNPIAFAFPSEDGPLILDFGTAMTTWGEVLLRGKIGKPLEEGWAVDRDGAPTTNPATALEGAFLPWGGHRGYGLSLVVQVLAILCGSQVVVDDVADCGFFFLVFDPELLMPLDDFKKNVAELTKTIEESRPAPGVPKVRIPGRASDAKRTAAKARGLLDIDDTVYATLLALANGSGEDRPA